MNKIYKGIFISFIELDMKAENIEEIDEIKIPYIKGITGSTLKIIAIISMVFDHIGAIILERILINRGIMEATTIQMHNDFLEVNGGFYYTYMAFRMIGRIAFPIFCFLLVEGFLNTHNVKKYLGRIFLFALISEIPFDLAFSGKFLEFGYQNIFFTLFFGILAIWGIQMAEKREWSIILKVLFSALVVGLCAGAVILLKTDYDILGIFLIVIIYLMRKEKVLGVGIGCIVLMQITSFFSLIPIYLYNGKRGINMKWFFYLFYPVHILLLYMIACAFGFGKVIL